MSTSNLLDRLRTVDLFADLTTRQLKKVADAGRTTSHAAGRVVAEEGLGALALHLVLSGGFEVSVRGSVLRTLGPGDYFGEISMIDGKPRSATVTATEPSECFAIPHTTFSRLLDTEADLAKVLLVSLAGRLRESEQR